MNPLEEYNLLLQQAQTFLTINRPDLLSHEDYVNYTNYVSRARGFDSNFDCSEIAEDLVDLLDTPHVLKIEPENNNGFTTFKVLENGQFLDYVNHYVVVKNGLIFDPRFAEIPIPSNMYIAYLVRVGGVPLTMQVEEW